MARLYSTLRRSELQGRTGCTLTCTDTALQAIQEGFEGPQVYDSRAAVYEKQGRKKDALLESKKVIDLFPQAWQVSDSCIRRR